MKLSIWSSYYMELSPEEAVERLISNGIYCCELSDEHGMVLLSRDEDVIATGRAFAEFIRSRNFEISQGHLWLQARICSDESAVNSLFKWIDLYEAIGIRNMVLHCDALADSTLSREEKIERNVEKLRILAEHIKGRDITVCLENLRSRTDDHSQLIDRTAEDLIYIIDRVGSEGGSEGFGICLDTGHLNITDKDQERFILTAGKRLKALHIADNEGKWDQHLMPFNKGSIDFPLVISCLKRIGYEGLFNLEIPGERAVPLELRDAKIGYIIAGYKYLLGLKG